MAELAPAPEVGKSFHPLVCNHAQPHTAPSCNRLNDGNGAFTRQTDSLARGRRVKRGVASN